VHGLQLAASGLKHVLTSSAAVPCPALVERSPPHRHTPAASPLACLYLSLAAGCPCLQVSPAEPYTSPPLALDEWQASYGGSLQHTEATLRAAEEHTGSALKVRLCHSLSRVSMMRLWSCAFLWLGAAAGCRCRLWPRMLQLQRCWKQTNMTQQRMIAITMPERQLQPLWTER
jgi:hypothetical protein